ncbi:MAG: hypothetical protein LBT20_03635 [Clostridiales bacterium]|nr:hypothetical protein [Clostridiales bacterium]
METREELIRKITAYTGFAIKSGGVVFGLDGIKDMRATVRVILGDCSLSEKSRKEIVFIAEKKRVPVFFLEGLGDIVKRVNVKVISIKNRELAIQILESCQKLSEVKEHE